ncbi:hypothetical protein MKZ38_010185 [Zalerion maritima]|uniref:FAS1 domain-containing protein n=1 Tax=Zalerion maritima TaxID=339359 RepID=A0AAD5RG44_9PEZI|nr:hypothetical protein MKZ38_010185 [Zalerion maritima]
MKPGNILILFATLVEPITSRRLFKPPRDARGVHLENSREPKHTDQTPLSGLRPTMLYDQKPQQPPADDAGSGTVLLSDMIGIDRRINIFASLVRDIESVSLRLDDGAVNTTVLAPLNSAIESLPRKPWEDPEDYNRLGDQAYEGDDGQERANRNLKRFVDAHIITLNPWKEGEKVQTLGSSKVWWEWSGGTRVVMPGNIEVEAVGRAVGNGEVWVLKAVRNYVQQPDGDK